MTYPGQENLPPLQLTTARWFNDYDEVADKWSKVIAHTGPYEQYCYGTDTEVTPERWDYLQRHHRGVQLQKAIICSPWSGVIGIDIDEPYSRWTKAAGPHQAPERELGFNATRTYRALGGKNCYLNYFTTRGSTHAHILVDMRAVPEDDWPVQVPVHGADIKNKGFIPWPGSLHYSGAPYSLFGRDWTFVSATEALVEAMRADQHRLKEHRRETGYYSKHGGHRGKGGGHDGWVAGRVLSMVRAGLSESECLAEWRKIAVAQRPDWPYRAGPDFFARHYRTAVRRAAEIEAEDQAALRSFQLFVTGARR